jgi:hypothetical protein
MTADDIPTLTRKVIEMDNRLARLDERTGRRR